MNINGDDTSISVTYHEIRGLIRLIQDILSQQHIVLQRQLIAADDLVSRYYTNRLIRSDQRFAFNAFPRSTTGLNEPYVYREIFRQTVRESMTILEGDTLSSWYDNLKSLKLRHTTIKNNAQGLIILRDMVFDLLSADEITQFFNWQRVLENIQNLDEIITELRDLRHTVDYSISPRLTYLLHISQREYDIALGLEVETSNTLLSSYMNGRDAITQRPDERDPCYTTVTDLEEMSRRKDEIEMNNL